MQYGYTELTDGNNSRLTSMTYPDGYKVDYNYNSGLDSNISRPSSLVEDSTQTTLEGYLYLGLDTVVERDHPQIKVNQTYIAQPGQPPTGDGGDKYVGLDRFGRVADQNWFNTNTSQSTDNFAYSYDQDGAVLTNQSLIGPKLEEFYQYDKLHRLTFFERTTSDIQTWTLDALGNFTSVSTDGPTDHRTINQQNQDTNISTDGPITYDNNGNLNSDWNGNTLTYDAWNRLVQVSNTGVTVASYRYDGLGRLIYFDDAGGNQPNQPTDQYYSSSGQVLETYVGGEAQARYVWSPVYVNALVLRDRSSGNDGKLSEERLYVQQDANWNVTALVNLSGSVVQRYQYLPYGAPSVMTPGFAVINIDFPWEDPTYNMQVLWQGMQWDSAMTVYMTPSGRDESPEELQAWLQTDFIGERAGPNGYAIEGNNPANEVDPSGLAPWYEKYGLSIKEQNKLGGDLQKIFEDLKDPQKFTCEQLLELARMLVKSNKSRGGVIDVDSGHTIRTLMEYYLYMAVCAALVGHDPKCGGTPPAMEFDPPAPTKDFRVPSYVTDTFNALGVKLVRRPGGFNFRMPKETPPNSWRMPRVSPIAFDPYACIRCHPWDGRYNSPIPPPYTPEQIRSLGIGAGVVAGSVLIIATLPVSGPAVAGSVTIGEVSNGSAAAAALLLALNPPKKSNR